MLTLITGGARSGKSTFAQSLCANAESVTYLATAKPDDAEMRERIGRHRASRPDHWHTIEEPLAVAETVANCASEVVLLDCITLWLSNLLFDLRKEEARNLEQQVLSAAKSLIEASQHTKLIAVTNEVGNGLVPETPVGRLFRDLQGVTNQKLAQTASAVYLLTCGIPLRVK